EVLLPVIRASLRRKPRVHGGRTSHRLPTTPSAHANNLKERDVRFWHLADIAIATLACHALGTCSPVTIPYHPLLASLAGIERRLQARLTARSQRAPPWGRYQRMVQAALPVAVSEASEALAGRT